MFQRLYARVTSAAAHPGALWTLAMVSFAESSFFPIPPDVLLAPMVMGAPVHAWRFAAVCTLASVLGGLAGYAIGALLFGTVGVWILDTYGLHEAFGNFQNLYNEHGAWVVAVGGLTPIPYKVVTIASGVTGLDLLVFTLASAASRGLRFFAEAALLKYAGPRIAPLLEKYFGWVMLAAMMLLISGFVLLGKL